MLIVVSNLLGLSFIKGPLSLVDPMSHTILLVQPDPLNQNSRTWNDYENLNLCLEAVCRIFEDHLKQCVPTGTSIKYDITDLFKFLDNLADLSCLVLNPVDGRYIPHGKKWIKERVFLLLRKQVS